MEPLVHVTRGDLIECTHFGAIAVCDAQGRLVGAVGDPAHRVYWRSSAKPVQALGVVHSGAADRFHLTAKELSGCCASHCGSAEHVAAVRSILGKIGLDETALNCGAHWPSDTAERDRLIRAGSGPSPLHNNCSGKHAGMLACAVALGADTASYLERAHPVQQSIMGDMSALSGVAEADIVLGVDGCGAITHGMTLQDMATAFARLSWPEEMPPPIQQAAPRIVAAMAAEPVMVAGAGSFTSALLGACGGRVVAKAGAEGLFVLGLTERGIGVAMRAVDGSSRGQSAVALRVLEQLDALDAACRAELAAFAQTAVTNWRGATVGEIRAAEFSLRA